MKILVSSFLACLISSALLAQFNSTEPSLSPDGKTLAFCSDRVANNALFLYDLSSGTTSKLVELTTYESSPSWSKEGGKIIFYAMEKDGGSEMYTVGVSNKELVNLTNGKYPSIGGPVWIEDKVLFSEGSYPTSNIYSMQNLELTGRTQLTDTVGLNYGPDLFEDELVYCVFSRTIKGLHLKNLKSNKTVRITETGERPSFSPDGSMIAFQKRVDGVSQIMVYDRKKEEEIQLTNCSDHCELPEWSIDGKNVYYQAKSDGYFQILKMDSNGKNQQMIIGNGID